LLNWLRSPAAAIRAAFFVQSLCIGGFFSRLAEIQINMHASPAELGIGLLGFDIGAFLTFPFASQLIARIGTRNAMLYGMPLFALAISFSSIVPNLPAFFAVSMAIAATFTLTAIAMNVEADRVEFATGRRIMNSCHGMWSLGFFVSSIIGTAIVALDISPALHLFSAVPIETAGTLLFLLPFKQSPQRPHSGDRPPARFVIPTVATLSIIAFAVGSIWLEAAGRTWSVIYLRDVFLTPNWLATLALPVYVGAQVVGRLLADGWIERFGPVRVAAVLSAVSFAGVALLVFGPNLWFAMAGFVLVGVGVATAFPQAVSAAARLGDRPATENVAAVQMMNSVVLFLAPPVMGFTATQWGLRTSFALILPLLVLAIVLSRNLAERPAVAAAAAAPSGAGD
jgi:MFS family permease